MKPQADSSRSLIDIEVYNPVFSSFHKEDFFTKAADTVKQTTQQAKVSLAETAVDAVNSVTVTADKAINRAAATAQQGKDYFTTTSQNAVDTLTAATSNSINTITATAEQTKGSLREMLQTTGQIKNTTTEAIQIAVNSSISEWLQAHPVVLRLVQMLAWASDHPILSLVIVFFGVAIAWSLVKLIGRLFEILWLSILQAPFKAVQFLIRGGSPTLHKFSKFMIQHLVGAKTTEPSIIQTSNSESNHVDKQQRLLEISRRLEALRKEQNELLREVMAIL